MVFEPAEHLHQHCTCYNAVLDAGRMHDCRQQVGRKIGWHLPPLAARLDHVQHRVHNPAQNFVFIDS
jgi:hypothetical protein